MTSKVVAIESLGWVGTPVLAVYYCRDVVSCSGDVMGQIATGPGQQSARSRRVFLQTPRIHRVAQSHLNRPPRETPAS